MAVRSELVKRLPGALALGIIAIWVSTYLAWVIVYGLVGDRDVETGHVVAGIATGLLVAALMLRPAPRLTLLIAGLLYVPFAGFLGLYVTRGDAWRLSWLGLALVAYILGLIGVFRHWSWTLGALVLAVLYVLRIADKIDKMTAVRIAVMLSIPLSGALLSVGAWLNRSTTRQRPRRRRMGANR